MTPYATNVLFGTGETRLQHGLREFDFIIVGGGGGTAAMVLANRLSERADFTVLVLEAGKSSMYAFQSRIPAAFYMLQRTSTDWNYRTVPQENCDNREMPWTRTKLLGGCSSGNAMIVHFGAPEDYDQSANDQAGADGAEGWAYQPFSKYIRKLEKFVPHPNVPLDVQHKGNEGPMEIGYFGFYTPIGDAFLPACEAVGIPQVLDVNTPAGTIGATRSPSYIDSRGRRVSTESAYLKRDTGSRPNLKVLTHVHVTKICTSIEDDKIITTGIEFAMKVGGPTHFVGCKREVILSAGAVNTPQILLLSGIGPSAEIVKHNIPIVKDLPGVGQHLRDHLSFNLRLPTKPGLNTRKWLKPQYPWQAPYFLVSLTQYLMFGTGPLTTHTQECMAFTRVGDGVLVEGPPLEEDSTSGKGAPDLEVLVSPLVWKDHGHLPFNVGDAMTITTALLRPTSKGTVTLRSADPWDAPLIDPNYFSTQHDIDIMVRAVKLSHKIAHAEPLASLLDHDKQHPLLDHSLAEQSDEEIIRVLKSRVETLYHPSCTARMAPLEDGGVVDTHLRVYGVQGLRVVDASVQPGIVTSTGPTIAIAEKASDLIKESYPQ